MLIFLDSFYFVNHAFFKKERASNIFYGLNNFFPFIVIDLIKIRRETMFKGEIQSYF